MFEKIAIPNKKSLKLSAVIGFPDRKKKYPAVILLHGFTGYKDEEHIVGLSEYLANNGYVTIRFDCSGFGESEGRTWDEYRVSNYVSDIESIYQFLLDQNYVDKSRMGVWGQSMGGMLSVIFASMHPRIKAACVVSATARIARANALEDELGEWKEKGYFDKWSSRYEEIKIPYDFIEDAKKWNALEAVKKVKVPLLVILGKDDGTVYPENTRQIFRAGNKPKQLFEIDGMDHDYKKHPGQIKKVNEIVRKFLDSNL